MRRVAILGGGQGGRAFLDILHKDPRVKIVGIADINSHAPGILLAKKLKIRTETNFKKLLNENLDIIFDVTGSKGVAKYLEAHKGGADVISGPSARLTWELIQDKILSKEEAERLLTEYQSLYEVGISMVSSENLPKIFQNVLDSAMRVSSSPAASLALLDEPKGEMTLVGARGFSREFMSIQSWKLRRGGLTAAILNSTEPLVIPDFLQHPRYHSPILLKEKIRAIVALPLSAKGQIVGILYVDDFKVRSFTPRQRSALSLLATMAALIIDKLRSLEAVQQQAITDELTGLYNHRYFIQQLQQEINRARRYHRPLSLIMLDIDHFKSYNDSYGHLPGNDVLRRIGKIIRETVREVDLPARYGGEEFVVIMPETQPLKAKGTAGRLRESIEESRFSPREGTSRRVTISLGVAGFPRNATQPFELIDKADAAMYRAKALGRNRVVLA